MADKRALIVDDDLASCSIWQLMLGEHGYEVLVADSLVTGLQNASEDIQLYLIDYHLPDGEGPALVADIRHYLPDAIIVTVSMDDEAKVIREAMNAGSNLFIVKPTSPELMSQVLAEIEDGRLSPTDRHLINRNGRRNYN